MKAKVTYFLAALALTLMFTLAAFSPMGAAIRAKLLCATETGNCVEGWNGTDVTLYRDPGGTETIRMDGDGAVRIAVPTQVGTATPGLVVQAGHNGIAIEVRNSGGTPVSSISGAGVLSGFGSSGLSVAPNIVVAAPTGVGTATPVALIQGAGVGDGLVVQSRGNTLVQTFDGGGVKLAAPTAIATAVPAAVVDSAGVSNLFEIRDAATPVYAARNGGTHAFNNGETTLNATLLDLNDTYIDQTLNTENIGIPTILTVPITYTAAAGGSGTVATIADGEIWFVHKVFIQVTTNFDATGDDATLVIGDGNDADGFIVAADANLQAAFTEATGFEPGFYGIEQGSGGAYTTDDGGPFVYLQSGAAETIDYLIDETSGETLTAGAATIYVIYTRIQ